MSFWMLPAAVASAGASFFGARRQNQINQQEAEKNRQFQAGEAALNRSFQERMRNTAWQAAVADMQAAGLNPALAFSQGPAASPGGSMAGGSQAAPAADELGGVSSSVLQMLQMRKSLRLMDEQIRKTGAEADIATANERLTRGRVNTLLNIEGGQEQLLRRLVRAEVESGEAGATNLRAMASRNEHIARILGPTADLAGDMGKLLPLLQLFMNPAGRAVGAILKKK